MTACVNKKSKRVAAVVTASLVGALSIGAPAVALAANVNLLAEGAVEAFNQGKVVLSETDATLEYTGKKAEITATSVAPVSAGEIKLDGNDDYRVYFVKADEKGNPTTTRTDAVEPGSYFVCVEAKGGDYKGGKAYAGFTVTGKSLSSATLKESNVSYDGEGVDLTFMLGTKKLKAGEDFTVTYGAKNSAATSETAPTNAGSYYAKLSGKGVYAGSSVNLDFTIAKVDVTSLKADDFFTATVFAGENLPAGPTTVKGSEGMAKDFVFWYGNPDSDTRKFEPNVCLTDAAKKSGNYTYLDDSLTKVDSGDWKTDVMAVVYRAANKATINYNGAALPEEMTFDSSKNEAYLEKNFLAFYSVNGEKVKCTSGFKFTYEDEDGNVTTSAPTAPGTYKVTVSIVDTAQDEPCNYGATATFTLKLTDGSLQGYKLYVTYDNKVVTEVSKTWDGKQLATPSVVVKDAYGFKVDDGDVTTVFTDAEGNEVELGDIVAAGDYTMTVKVNGQDFDGNTVPVKVAKLNVSGFRIVKEGDKYLVKDASELTEVAKGTAGALSGINGHYSLKYDNGKAIDPIYVYSDGTRDDEGDLVWKQFKDSIAEDYLNQSLALNGEEVSSVKKRGSYTMTLALSEAVDAKNMELTAPAYSFDVDKAEKFSDVKEGAWYYEVVNKAADNGYINGYAGTTLFGPEAQIKRGDVACVLFNMAGAPDIDNDNFVDEDGNFLTGFSDVNGHAYYAQAIAWAKQAGVVNGYGDGTFKPESMVTREEFACMLANYAKLTGNYEAADSKVLDSFADKGSVSDWAVDSVAWAVEGEIMGNGGSLDGTGVITRAQVAAMAVNYQPAKLEKPTK